jgi:hypothetical protein
MYHYRIILVKNWSTGMQTRSTHWLDLIEPYNEKIELDLIDEANCEVTMDPLVYFYTMVEDITYLGYAPVTPTTNKSYH